jgi:Matrixin
MNLWTIKLFATSIVMLMFAVSPKVSASDFLGFRLLDLDGTAVRWGSGRESSLTVTYAFVRNRMQFPNARNCRGVDSPDSLLANSNIDRAIFEQEVRAAFVMWEQVAGIIFQETSDVASAGILIGSQMEPAGHAFANVEYRPNTGKIRQIEKSLICLNPSKRWKIGFGGGLDVYDLRYTIAHEIGHAIGLDHPESGNQLMSFSYRENFRNLQPGDIEGAVRIYGARTAPQIEPTEPQLSAAASRPRG